MEKYYSKIEPDKLLHIVRRLSDIVNQEEKRVDIINENNFIQCSSLKLKEGTTFKPHKHIFKERHYERQIAQESWVVLRGLVKCIFYDLDDTVLTETYLQQGDASITLQGGHNYVIMEDDTIVLEYKTGPYEGVEFDKIFL